ncbi:MAG: hypothetical protein PWR10_1356 [Halanaerobiales bacterium]|nr:hypothetical protein [Halanaerobiales bacterium]
MENLEKIDLIRERLGVSYEEANRALKETGGDVVEALIKLEKETAEKGFSLKDNLISVKGQELINKIKEIIKEGNVNKIVVKSKDKTLVEIPVTAGVVSLVLFPYITLLAGLAAMFKEYTLEIEKDKDKNNES